MAKFNSLGEMASELRRIQRNQLPKSYAGILGMVGELATEDAKERIVGRVSPLGPVGPFNAWDPLTSQTIEQKERYGLGKGGDPRSMLWATGQMDESIGFTVNRVEQAVFVGTNDHVAAYHEYGTSRMEPRPFLGPAMYRTVERLQKPIENVIGRTLEGKRPF